MKAATSSAAGTCRRSSSATSAIGFAVPIASASRSNKRPELERDEQRPHLLRVGGAHHAVLGRQVQLEVGDDPRELLVQRQPVRGGDDVLLLLAFELVGAREQLLHRSEGVHELGRGLVADARHPRDVVGGVALERHEVEVLLGRDAVASLDGRRVHPVDLGDAPPVEQHADRAPPLHPVAHQLEEVPVGGDDHRVEPRLARLDRQGADRVVGLVARHPDHRDPQRRRAPLR